MQNYVNFVNGDCGRFFPLFSCDSSSISRNVGWSVCRSVCRSVTKTKCERLLAIPLLPTCPRLRGSVYGLVCITAPSPLSASCRISGLVHIKVIDLASLDTSSHLYKRVCPYLPTYLRPSVTRNFGRREIGRLCDF